MLGGIGIYYRGTECHHPQHRSTGVGGCLCGHITPSPGPELAGTHAPIVDSQTAGYHFTLAYRQYIRGLDPIGSLRSLPGI